MGTKNIWESFTDEYQNSYYCNTTIAKNLLINIVLTPFAILLDIIFLPIEIIYLITLKIINKIRDDEE